MPKGSGPHPAVVMLHGASTRKDAGNAEYEKMCGELADLGYYVEFIEYYSQTDAVGPGQPVQMKEDFPIWLEEIHSGLDALDKNPSVDPHRVALMGFSLGSFLSLSAGAIDPEPNRRDRRVLRRTAADPAVRGQDDAADVDPARRQGRAGAGGDGA